jgi:hypothetical protein
MQRTQPEWLTVQRWMFNGDYLYERLVGEPAAINRAPGPGCATGAR